MNSIMIKKKRTKTPATSNMSLNTDDSTCSKSKKNLITLRHMSSGELNLETGQVEFINTQKLGGDEAESVVSISSTPTTDTNSNNNNNKPPRESAPPKSSSRLLKPNNNKLNNGTNKNNNNNKSTSTATSESSASTTAAAATAPTTTSTTTRRKLLPSVVFPSNIRQCRAAPETPEILETKLREFDQALRALPEDERRAITQVQQQQQQQQQHRCNNNSNSSSNNNNNNIATMISDCDSDDFRLRFLRTEILDVPRAVRRYCHYWELRVRLFRKQGFDDDDDDDDQEDTNNSKDRNDDTKESDRAIQPANNNNNAIARVEDSNDTSSSSPATTNNDTLCMTHCPDDLTLLRSGICKTVPGHPRIICVDPSRVLAPGTTQSMYHVDSIARTQWYMFTKALDSSVELQCYGGIIVIECRNCSYSSGRALVQLLQGLAERSNDGFPLRLASACLIRPPRMIGALWSVAKWCLRPRVRDKVHMVRTVKQLATHVGPEAAQLLMSDDAASAMSSSKPTQGLEEYHVEWVDRMLEEDRRRNNLISA